MKKLLTAALTTTLGMALAGTALATETRVNSLSAAGGLGGAFNEKSITLRDKDHSRLDTAAINTFPQWMVWHKNSVDVDNTAGTSYGSMNVRYALSDDPTPPVLLLFGKRSPWAPVIAQPSIGGTNAGTVAGGAPGVPGYTGAVADATNHQFGIGFAMKAGEAVRLGATLSIGGNRNDKTGTMTANGSNNQYADENSNTWVNFNGGVGFDINEVNSMDFGLNIMAGTFTNMDNNNLARYLSDGLFGVAFTAKGEFLVSQIARLVPYLRVQYDSRNIVHQARNDEPSSGNDSKVGTVNNTWVILGTDLAIMPPNLEGVLIQPGVGFIFRGSSANGSSTASTAREDVEITNNLMPWYGFSAEAKAFEWCYLRLGARQVISRTNVTNTLKAPYNNEDHNSTVTNTVSTGLGIKLLGWNLDVNMNPAFFNNGVAAVTGNATPGWGIDWALLYEW